MPKRKITIDEALKVLEEAGIPLQAKPVEPLPEPVKPKHKGQIFDTAPKPVTDKLMRITLFAKHSVGSGGTLVTTGDEKNVEHAGVQTYGPGVCVVKADLAAYLLGQDAVAKQADDKMLDRTQHSFLVVQRRSPSGMLASVGVEVDSDILNGGLGDLPSSHMFLIR